MKVTTNPIITRNQFNYLEHLTEGEVNNSPSMTIPDQTLSIREILVRYSRGLPIPNTKTPIYEEDGMDMPDPKKLDLAEREEYQRKYTTELASILQKRYVRPTVTNEP